MSGLGLEPANLSNSNNLIKSTEHDKCSKTQKLIYSVISRIFFRWSKWEIYKSDIPHLRTEYSHITGYESQPDRVMVDIYVKTNLYTGLKKYKRVIKWQ